MASVVFLRAVNVGGHQGVRTSAVAKALADLDVVNVGAAGTFVVRASAPAAKVEAAFVEALGFDPGVYVVPAKDVLALAARDAETPAGEQRFVTVLAAKPRKVPPLPVDRPAGKPWEVRLVEVRGRFVVSHRRVVGKTYPNAVVEKELGVAGTTRGWNTVETVARKLGRSSAPAP